MAVTSIDAQRRTEGFARVIGPYVVLFTGTYAIRLPEMMPVAQALFASVGLTFMLATLMIFGGLVIIGGHRHWRTPAAVVISLFGWFVGLRGLALMVAPSSVESAANTAVLSPGLLLTSRIFFGLLALMGLWLTYVGWFQKTSEKLTARQAVPQPA